MKYILIIEDDPLAQKAYCLKFSHLGAEVKSAVDGREALKFVNENSDKPPAAILLDLMLPYVSGFEILETIRKTKGWENTPVFILSNLSQESDIEKTKSFGATEYLVKADTRIEKVIEKVMKFVK